MSLTKEEQVEWDALGEQGEWSDEDEARYQQLDVKRRAEPEKPEGHDGADEAAGDESSDEVLGDTTNYAEMSDEDFLKVLDGFVPEPPRRTEPSVDTTNYAEMSDEDFEKVLEGVY